MDISKLRFVKQLFINGKFVNSVRNQTFDLINPNDETVLTSVQRGTTEDIDLAVAASRQGFENGPWGRMDPTDRAAILFRFADLIEKNVVELGTIEAINVGKPVEIAKMLDVPLSDRCYCYCAGWVDKIRGNTIPWTDPSISQPGRNLSELSDRSFPGTSPPHAGLEISPCSRCCMYHRLEDC